MDADRFWAMIQASRKEFDATRRDGNMDAQCRLLEKLLGVLAPDDVVAFQRAFDDRMRETYRWDLWGAAYIIEGGCSDDGFTDFRSWLISMGRDVFESALRDPESLVDVASADGVEVCSFEEFQYIPGRVYEEMTDEELPDGDDAAPHDPAGNDWVEEDLPAKFPRLWERYGDG